MIATLLRYFRNLHNLKQKTVADLLGMSQANYSDLENGKTKLNDTAAEKLSRHYGVPSSEFYTYSSSEIERSNKGLSPEQPVNLTGNKQYVPIFEKDGSVQTIKLSKEEIKELTLQIQKIADTSSVLLKWLTPNNSIDLR